MSTVTSQVPSYRISSPRGDVFDNEPDKAWKDALKAKIEEELSSMVADAKKNLQDELDKEAVTLHRREQLTREYNAAMRTIRDLAEGTFHVELERERQERRWAAGKEMLPQWTEALKQEQQDIMDRIKGSQKESASSSTVQPPEETPPPEPALPAEVHPTGTIPVELPPELAEKRERQRREEEERARDRKERERLEWERQERVNKEKRERQEKERQEKLERERREKFEEEKRARLEEEKREQERLEEQKEQERLEEQRKGQEKENVRKERKERKLLKREAKERLAREKEDRKKEDLERERQREEFQRQEVEKERERERQTMRGATRRGSVNRSHQDYSGPPSVPRRSSHSTVAERQANVLPESEGSSDLDEGPVYRVPERSLSIRRPSLHERPVDPPISRSIEHVSRLSLERHTARSPPNSIHQIWKPSSPEEDIRPPSTAPLARRNSTTSIRSTGSAGHRPTITEPILERSDSEAEVLDDDILKAPEPETTWSSPMPRPKDKEKRREHRKSSASDHNRFDEAPPSFPGPPRTPHRPEEIHPLPPRTFSDRYDDPPSAYGGSPWSQYRPDDIGPRPPSSMRPPMMHKTSYNAPDEWDHPQYPPNGPPRSVKSRTSFDERPYLYAQPPTPSGRMMSRPPSIPVDEREYYDAPYRSYPTPPASVSRLSGREHPPQAWYPATRTDYPDGRSNTYKWAQQPESPSMRRSSGTGQPPSREPSYGSNYTDESYPVHGAEYPRPYDRPPSSASIPISRRRQDSAGMEEEGWKTWATEQTGPPPRRRDSERRGGGYSYQERDDGRDRDHDYGGRNGRDGRDWAYDRDRDRELSRELSWGDRGDRPNYGPPPDLERREHWRPTHRSPTSSFNGNPAAHSFGGRDVHQSVSVGDDDTDGYEFHGQETDVESDHEHDERDRRREERRRGTARELEREEEAKEREKEREETWRKREESWKLAQAVKEDEERKKREAEAVKLAEEKAAEEEARRIEREAEAEERARVEAARKADQEKEEEERRIADEARRVADEKARQLAAAEARKLEEARKKAEEEAKKLKEREAEIRRKAAEVRKKEEEAKRKEEEAQRKEEEAQRKEEEAQRKEREAKLKEQEARKKEQEAKKKEQEARKKEAEARKKEEEARRKEWDAQQKEEEARRREEEAHSKEEVTRRKEEEIRQREEELRKREEELTRREQEIASQKEAERLQREWDMEEDARRLAEEKKRAEDERQERFRREQQEEFRRREQEIRQKVEERKRQDSVGADNAWIPPSSSYTQSTSTRSFSQSSVAPERNGQTSGWTSTTGSAWSSSKPTPSANPSASTASSTAKPRSGSINATYPPSTPSPHPPSAKEESEWRRRHEEQFQRQQERFREEQQRMENARQQRAQGTIPTSDEILGVYEKHERMWEKLPSVTELRWESVPWPTFRPPRVPEDITYNAVLAYLQSPLYPEKDKSRPYKDRLKEHIRRWHPDRFETKTLPRVVEEDQERVKEAAGSVVRTLNDLLMRSNAPSPFA